MKHRGLSEQEVTEIIETEIARKKQEEQDKQEADVLYKIQTKNENKKQGKRDMLWGAVWCLSALLATAFTAVVADLVGASWYIGVTGPFVYGIIRFFRGIKKLGE